MLPKINDLRLITFDLDNTLWDIWPVIEHADRCFLAWLKTHHAACHAHFHGEAIAAARSALLAVRPELAGRPTSFRKAVIDHVLELAQVQGAVRRQIVEDGFEVFYHARNQVVLYPGVERVLAALAARCPLIAISNGNADLGRIGLARFFSGHYLSESSGRPKPHPEMFRAALRQVGARPDQGLHVGDHLEEDVRAAQAIGMHGLWYNPDPARTEPGVLSISNLEALPERLGLPAI